MVDTDLDSTLRSFDEIRNIIEGGIQNTGPDGSRPNRIEHADWLNCSKNGKHLTSSEKVAWAAVNILTEENPQLNQLEAALFFRLVFDVLSDEYFLLLEKNPVEAKALLKKRMAATQTADKISPVVGGPEKRPLDVVLKGFDRKQQEYLKTAVEEAKRIVFTVPNMDKQSLALAATNLDAIFLAPFSSKSVWQPQGTGPHLDASRPSQSQ